MSFELSSYNRHPGSLYLNIEQIEDDGSIIAICIVNETFYGVSKVRPRFSLKLKERGLTPQVSPLGPPTL